MRKSVYLMVLTAVMLMSCGRFGGYDDRLLLADSLMSTSPDSSLLILQSIDPDRLSSEHDRALHALLLSQAYDKNYIDLTSDSIISIAVGYYANTEEFRYAMLAHYYHGRIFLNAHNYPSSLGAMIKALSLAEKLEDCYWSGRIAQQISFVYGENYHGSDAIYYAQMACEKLKQSKRQPYINYSLLSLARIYNNSDKDQQCIEIAEQLLDSAAVYNDSLLSISAKRVLAKAYFGNKEKDKSVRMIYEIAQNHDALTTDLRCFLGLCFLDLREKDKAEEIFKSVGDDYCDDDLSLIYEVSKIRGDTAKMLEALDRLYDNLDDKFSSAMNKNFSQTLSQLHKYEIEKQNAELVRTKKSRTAVIVLGISVIMILLAIFSIWYKKYTGKLNKNILIAQNLRDMIQLKQTEFYKAQEHIQQLITSRFEIIDNLCKTIYESKATGLEKKKISAEIESMVEQFSTDKNKITELENIIDSNKSNLISDFKKDLPNLKMADYLLFLYSVLGFSTNAIALFLKEDKIDAIYNRKARLKQKIRKLESVKSNLYLQYL